MAVTISRRKIALHVADELAKGRPAGPLVQQLAAYLVDRRLVSQTDLMARDIEATLARDHGLLLAEVISARELSDAILQNIRQFVATAEGAKQVEVSANVDPSLLGGVIIRTPRAELNTTIRKQLNALRS